MAAGLSQFQYIIIILIFGSKVLLLAKNVNLYLFLSVTKSHDWHKWQTDI